MTKSELIEKYAAMVPRYVAIDRLSGNSKGELIFDDEAITDLFTRLLEAYDAQKPVEGWHLRLADKLLADKQYIADMPITRESLAALIASHAPKEYPLYKIEDGKVTQATPQGVDVESVWEELRLDETVEFPNWDGSGEPHFLMISKQQLAAALASVQKGSGE